MAASHRLAAGGCVSQHPLQADQGGKHIYCLGPALVDVHPPRKLVQVRADAGKLTDVLLFQGSLPQSVVQSALPDEIRHGLALGLGLGGDGRFFRRSDAQLDQGCLGRMPR